jgi:hypothetical protein
MNTRAISIILGFAVLASAACNGSQGPAGPKTGPAKRVMFVGNSYTYFNNLPAIVQALAKAGGRSLEIVMFAPGGWKLKDHWEKGGARQALREGRWDFVILQDQSTLGVDLYVDGKTRVDGDGIFRPYALTWSREIAKAGATPVFFLTWARQASPEDQDRLTYAYMTAGRDSGSRVAPVGLAWKRVREEHPEIGLFQSDGSHPSAAGSYLAACAIYSALFDENPDGLPHRISGRPVNLDTEKIEEDKTAVLVDLDPGTARILQSAAWSAWRNLQKQGGYVLFPAPPEPAPEPLPAGAILSANEIEGTWKGELLLHPSGPVRMTLAVKRSGTGWAGHLTLDYGPPDIADESADVEALDVSDKALMFSFPRSAATAGLRIDFRGVAEGAGEIRGVAEASKSSPNGSLRLVGSWHAVRQ